MLSKKSKPTTMKGKKGKEPEYEAIGFHIAHTGKLEWTRVPSELDSGASVSLIGLNFLTRKMRLIQGDHIHNEARRVTGVD